MALRQEDLGGAREAVVYRFPTERAEIREQRRRIAARRRRIARRRRLAVVGVTIVMVAGFLLATGPAGTATASRDDAPRAVVMRQGQTLWSLAERYAPADVDPRAYVDAVLSLNGGIPPQAGARVVLP